MATHPMKHGTFTVSSGYGSRWGTFHAGLDFAAPIGTPIYAAADALVIEGKDRTGVSGFGSWIWLDAQESAGVDLIYGHVQHAGILVRQGDRVKAGQQIGVVGNEGETTGPHLHFEVWGPPGRVGGAHRDPAAWLAGADQPGATAAPAPAPSTDKGTNMDWWKVEPDVYRLLNKHYTPGRAGRIQYIVRHHNAGVLSINQIWDVWQQRQASAHYQVEVGGRIGQLVNDSDTAWHAANATVNANSIGIEHANTAGAGQDWPISDITIVNGAKLAAALCWFYKLGRPHFGANIRDHRQYTTTSCPHHLAAGGKYHDRWMQVAQQHYDFMVANPNGAPEQGGFLMALSDAEQRELLAKTRDNHRELNQLYPSRSKYRVDDKPVDTLAGFILNIDGRIHEQFIEGLAKNLGKTPEQVAQALSDAVKAAK